MTTIEIIEFQAHVNLRKNQIRDLMQEQLKNALKLKCCTQLGSIV